MPLTRKQLSELQSLIKGRREALGTEIRSEVSRSREESFGELAGPVTDSADEASADLLSDVDNAEVTRDLHELRELEAAQERMAEGRYGDCVDCKTEIGFERLRANPAATRCIACQRVHEKTYAHPGEPRL
jgi:RNA polymerase-binding transcription factor DksA